MTAQIDILLVEDDEAILTLYNALFSTFTKYSFVSATTGEKVEELLKVYEFKIGIIDIRLAGPVNGVDVAVMLHDKYPHMILYAMTGLPFIFDDIDPSVAGFTTCFAKPSGFMDLLAAVKDILG